MNAFLRLQPSKTWFRGAGLAALLWSLAAALLAGVLLVLLTLLVDLLVFQGAVDLPGPDLQRIAPAAEDVLRGGTPAELDPESTYHLSRLGLTASLLRYRDWLGSGSLYRIGRRTPMLRDNDASAVILVFALLVVGLARSLCASRARLAAARLAAETTLHLRQSVHRQALRLAPGALDAQPENDAIDLFVHEIDRIGGAAAVWVARVPGDLLLAAVLLGLAVWADPRLSLQCLVPAALAWWMTLYARGRSLHLRELAESRAQSDLRLLAEGLRRSRLVSGYAMDAFDRDQFHKLLDRYTRTLASGRKQETWMTWSARGGSVLCFALVVFFISARVLSTTEAFPLPLGLLLFAALVWIGRLIQAAPELPAARQTLLVCGDKVQRYVNAIPEVGQAVGAKFLEPVSKSIIFESISYRLNGRPLLKDFDLRIAAGSTTAVVALDPTAARAVAYLLPRFIEPQSGRVLFDSEDTAWATLDSLRAETILVGGDDPPISGTVLENLTCGDARYSLQDATDAAKVTHAHNFIVKLPQGYETPLGEHGERLDPGQSFRLGLARALLRKPAVIVIEEPRHTLDEDTKNLLDDAYQRLLKGRTVIFLPTRLSTVRRCDQVVLIHDGRVAAAGTHETLVRQSELYRHWEYVTFTAVKPPEPSRPSHA